MIDPQVILKQVRQGDIPDNWQIFYYTGLSRIAFIYWCTIWCVIWCVIYLLWMIFFIMLFNLLLGENLLFSSKFLLLSLSCLTGLPVTCLSARQRGVASLVILPDGVIHVVDDRYLLSHFNFLTSEGRRGKADYRSKVMHSLSKHTYAWYPCKILSFADIASIQLHVTYVRGIWLELHYHNEERKKWLIETYLDPAAVQNAQSIIEAYTRYITEHPQPIEQA